MVSQLRKHMQQSRSNSKNRINFQKLGKLRLREQLNKLETKFKHKHAGNLSRNNSEKSSSFKRVEAASVSQAEEYNDILTPRTKLNKLTPIKMPNKINLI